MQPQKINLKLTLLMLFILSVLSNLLLAQGITIKSGTTITGGSATITLPGNWNDSGTFTAGSSTVCFNSASGNQTITNSTGEIFYNVTVNKAGGDIQLSNNIIVNGTLTLTSGDVGLNGKTITLGGSATLSETAGNTVKGTTGLIITTRSINAPGNINIGGMGAELTSSDNLGSTIITRGHTAQTGSGNTGITRYIDITPTNNISLNATLVFHYDDSELNGVTESELQLFRSTDGGSTWTAQGATVNNIANNTVTLTGIYGFSRWTLAGSSAPLKLATPVLSSPGNEATGQSLLPTLDWGQVTSANMYRLEVNTSSDFTGTVIYDQDTVSLPSKQIGGLTDNTKYYWRVTASNSSGNSSDVSSVSNFTTAQAASGEVTLISPPPSTIDASTNPTISWPVTNGASKYHLEVNTASNFTGTVVIDANITSTFVPITGLNYNTTYYWRVAATSNSLSKTTTTVYSFTTKLAPPTLLSPADSTVGVSIDPTLVWSAMTNVTRYNLLMSKNPYFTTIVLQKQLPDTSYHVDTNLDQNTQYYWKVSAVNSQGNAGEYTSPGSFTTGTGTLPVELMDFSANVIEDKVQLSWSTATEVNNYGFEVQRSANSNQQSAESRFAGGELNAGSWQRIGFVPGAGNSNSPKHYSFSDRPTEGTSFSYRLKQVDVNGDYKYYDPIAVTLTTKQTIVLMQNSPNPFNPSTVIKFYIPNNSDVSIKIYDMLGKEVTTLVNKQTEAGYHIVYWNGRDNYGNSAASGMYLYRLVAGNFVETKKMLLMK